MVGGEDGEGMVACVGTSVGSLDGAMIAIVFLDGDDDGLSDEVPVDGDLVGCLVIGTLVGILDGNAVGSLVI